MKRLLALACCAAFLFSGCGYGYYEAPVMPPRGLLFTKVTHPLTTNYQETAATTDRKAESKSTYYLWELIFSRGNIGWDNAGIQHIATEGNIHEIYYAELEVTQFLLFYGRYRVLVYGN